MGPLQGLGIATMLIGAGEQRVHARGLAFAALGVEDNNPRARHLYRRLGYRAAGRQHASWDTEDDTGVLRVYETRFTILRKRLPCLTRLCGAPYGLAGPRRNAPRDQAVTGPRDGPSAEAEDRGQVAEHGHRGGQGHSE